MAAAKGYKDMGGRPQGCWGRALTVGRVPSGPNLKHGPWAQNKVTQHFDRKRSAYENNDWVQLRIDMDVRPDLFESRLDTLSTKSKITPIGVRMKLWQQLQVENFLQSETNIQNVLDLESFLS